MLEVNGLNDVEFKLLEIQYLELQEERKRLQADRQKFEAQCAVKAFEDKLEQNARDRLNIDGKANASERRANMKENIDQRVEKNQDTNQEVIMSKRDRVRLLRARRLAAERKERFGTLEEEEEEEKKEKSSEDSETESKLEETENKTDDTESAEPKCEESNHDESNPVSCDIFVDAERKQKDEDANTDTVISIVQERLRQEREQERLRRLENEEKCAEEQKFDEGEYYAAYVDDLDDQSTALASLATAEEGPMGLLKVMSILSQAGACHAGAVFSSNRRDDERTCKDEVESDNEEKNKREYDEDPQNEFEIVLREEPRDDNDTKRRVRFAEDVAQESLIDLDDKLYQVDKLRDRPNLRFLCSTNEIIKEVFMWNQMLTTEPDDLFDSGDLFEDDDASFSSASYDDDDYYFEY